MARGGEAEGPPGDGIRPVHVVLLVFLGLAWGSSFLFTEIAVRSIPPATLAAARIIGGAVVLWGVASWRGAVFPRTWRPWLFIFVAGLTGNALPFVLIGWGQVRIDSSLAAILLAATPLFTLALVHVFTADDRLTPAKVAGVALGFAGVLLLLGPDVQGALDSALWGQLAVVGAAFGFAVTYLVARRLRRIPAPVSGAGALACAALWVVPASLAVDRPWTLTLTLESSLAALALALISTAGGSLAFYWLVARTRATFVSLTNYIIPVVGVMWGVVLLGEPLGWRALAALVVILAGIALASAAGRRRGRVAVPRSREIP